MVTVLTLAEVGVSGQVDFTHYRSVLAQAGADLVNTWGSESGTEFMGTAQQVVDFLKTHEFGPPYDVTEVDIRDLHRLRGRLKKAFTLPEQEAADILNELLQETDARPHLTDHDGSWHFHYVPVDAPIAQRVGAATAMALASVIAEFGSERLGTCAADNCGDVFVDMSRNRSRRYCDDNCASRTNVAAYRRRQARGS